MTEGTKILRCNCENTFQDKLYGKQMRVHNICQGGNNKDKVAYCTVCSPRTPKWKVVAPSPVMNVTKLFPADPERRSKPIR